MYPTEVHFPTSFNIKLSGHLYVPDTYTPGQKLPGIVVVHPGGGVKEQTAGTYAKHLMEHGFIALAFDRATQGASEGTPRHVENPYQAAEDIKAAVSYLSAHNEVDPQRVGVLGICAGGGYSIHAASTDQRVKVVATISMADIARLCGAIPKDQFEAAQVAAGEARTQYARTGEVQYVPLLPPQGQIPDDAPPLMREGSEYYLTSRGSHPRSDPKMVAWSYEYFVDYDPFCKIERISPRPLLLVAGGNADTLVYSQMAYDKASEPKELYLIPEASHVELYDHKVNMVVPKVTEFFKKNL
ncbi:hypothetical protein BGW42_003798 [Actinomortierella wolfii]|nr:hypothetical protein BGW42_003798 [Actinomortierella wolfii]